jgi:predicted RNase H-like HicB family nuclease
MAPMDPDEALKNAREALARHTAAKQGEYSKDRLAAGDDLAEAFEALDAWMSKKSFPPEAWDRGLEDLDP